MLHIGRAGHPGPGKRFFFSPGQLSVEFVNVGGWLTYGDLALDSCAQFLAVAERMLIPSATTSICHQLREAGHHFVWSPACQDQVAGGHAGVGVVCRGGATLSLPSFVTQVGQDFENHSSYWFRRSGSSLCRQRLRISAGRFVDLALAYSLGAGVGPDATRKFKREDCVGSRGDFIVGCPDALAASTACKVTDRWFTPHLLNLLAFVLMRGRPILLARRCVSWSDLLVGWILLIGLLRRLLVLFRISGICSGRSLGWFQLKLYLLLGSSVDDFWSTWSRHAEAGLFRAYSKAWWSH